MGYDCIRIERERSGFKVTVTDPEIEKSNRARDTKDGPCGAWRDPNVEFIFDDVPKTLAFVEKAIEIALPQDTYTTAFDKIAKEVGADE